MTTAILAAEAPEVAEMDHVYGQSVLTVDGDRRGPPQVYLMPWNARRVFVSALGSPEVSRLPGDPALCALLGRAGREYLRSHPGMSDRARRGLIRASVAQHPDRLLRWMLPGSSITDDARKLLRLGLACLLSASPASDEAGPLVLCTREEAGRLLAERRYRARMRNVWAVIRACGGEDRAVLRRFLRRVRNWPSYRERSDSWAYRATVDGWVASSTGGVNARTLRSMLEAEGIDVPRRPCAHCDRYLPDSGEACLCRELDTLSYGSPIDIEFRGAAATEFAPRYVGVEIEVCGTLREHIGGKLRRELGARRGFLMSDGSLPSGGFELITSPARGESLISDLAAYGRCLRELGAWTNGSAGAHVHVDVRDLSVAEKARVICLYAHVEQALYGTLAYGRDAAYDDETYASPAYSGRDWSDVCADMAEDPGAVYRLAQQASQQYRSVPGCIFNSDRYVGLNLASDRKHGTMEFRLWPGSVSAERLTLQALVSAHIVEAGRSMEPASYADMGGRAMLRRIVPESLHAALDAAMSHRFYAAGEDPRYTSDCRLGLLPIVHPVDPDMPGLDDAYRVMVDGEFDREEWVPQAERAGALSQPAAWPADDRIPF